jgi:hypothetical protein
MPVPSFDSMQEEPVSEDLEEACNQSSEIARKNKAETTSPFFSEGDYKLGFKDGAQWQKQRDNIPVSEDLEKAASIYMEQEMEKGAWYIDDITDDFYYRPVDLCSAFKAGANWQKQQDKQWLAEEHKNIFAKGRESMKEQMDEYLKDMSNEIDLIDD